ncbi:Diacetylchitobiose uptake system permease protein NgcG [Moorella thermoacetica]
METILKHSLLLIYALIIIVPLSLVFFATFKNTAQLYSNPVGLPQQWNLSNYIQLFTSQNMFVYFKNSIIVTFTSVFFILLLGSMISYAIIRLPKVIGNLLLGFVTLGMMIPVQVNMIPTYLLLSRLKMLNTHLGLILVTIATLLPICVFILTGFMKTLPRGLIEAAMIDGASHWKIYSKIVIPLSLPSLAAAAIFCFVITWNDLLYPMLFLKTGSLRTLPVALLQFQGEYLTNYPLIFSGVVVASLPMIIIYVFLQRYFVEGMTAGSIKG